MKLLYFAWLRERIGMGEEEITLPDNINTPAQLVDFLKAREERYALAFEDMSAIRVALDQEMTAMEASLKDVREVAFFPPVTGG